MIPAENCQDDSHDSQWPVIEGWTFEGLPKEGRARNFAIVVYPESIFPDWDYRFSESCIKGFMSPLHDKDKAQDGSLKKAHYHGVLLYDGKKNPQAVIDDIRKIFGDNTPKHVICPSNTAGYVKYLTHMNTPNDKYKFLYSPSDVRCFGGADYDDYCFSKAEITCVLGDIFDYIRENSISSYNEFVHYLRHGGAPDEWFSVYEKKSHIIHVWIRELKEDKKQRKLDEKVDEMVYNAINSQVGAQVARLDAALSQCRLVLGL